MSDKLSETTVNKKYVYNGKILNVRCDDALLPDGKPCVREMVEHPGGAAVLAECDGKIAFVRQFRYPYGEIIVELPAGKLEKGEAPVRTVERELSEETGLVADKFCLWERFILLPDILTKGFICLRQRGYAAAKATPTTASFCP